LHGTATDQSEAIENVSVVSLQEKVLLLPVMLVVVVPEWRICSKAGRPECLGQLMLDSRPGLSCLDCPACAGWPKVRELTGISRSGHDDPVPADGVTCC
jgi:hypothetical protein